MGKIQSLSEELSDARTQLEELYSAGQMQQRTEYEERERNYKHIIDEMKEQLKREHGVPLEHYQSAVAEARQRAAECQTYQHSVSALAVKVASLEQKLRDEVANKKDFSVPAPAAPRALTFASQVTGEVNLAPPPPPPPSHSTNVLVSKRAKNQPQLHSILLAKPSEKTELQTKMVRIQSPPKSASVALHEFHTPRDSSTSPAADDNEHYIPDPKAPTPRKAQPSTTPKSADRCKLRSSAVRAAGGRMALQKKLREMRSPKPVEHYQRKLEQMGIRPLPLREQTNR